MYSDSGNIRLIEYYKVEKRRHAWSGGKDDLLFSDGQGPDASLSYGTLVALDHPGNRRLRLGKRRRRSEKAQQSGQEQGQRPAHDCLLGVRRACARRNAQASTGP
jgi:hypothetical protein